MNSTPPTSIGFVDYASRQTDAMQRLVVDLSGLTFFSTAGFSALHTLNVRCVGENIRWVLVPGKAVNRLLRISRTRTPPCRCATASKPAFRSSAEPRRLLELVAEPR